VGPTGAGKSTLLSLLPRFYDADGGHVPDRRRRTLRDYRLTALAPARSPWCSSPRWCSPATLRENIAFGRPEARPDEIVAAARLGGESTTPIEALRTGTRTLVGEQGVTLSEGEKAAGHHRPRPSSATRPILILDEPTSSLDGETEALIMQGLERLTAGGRRSSSRTDCPRSARPI